MDSHSPAPGSQFVFHFWPNNFHGQPAFLFVLGSFLANKHGIQQLAYKRVPLQDSCLSLGTQFFSFSAVLWSGRATVNRVILLESS